MAANAGTPVIGKRKHHRQRVMSEINVTPMVDVMLVLLIIFMVAAPMLQRGVEVNLPQTRRAQRLSEERLYVTVPLSFRKDRKVFLDDEAVSIDFVAERIRQAMLNEDQKEVFLRGDSAVQVQELLDVIGRLREGGIERVGIVALEQKR